MKNFLKLAGFVNTDALSLALQLHPELWNQDAERRNYAHSPHQGTADIWLRYNDPQLLDPKNYKAWTQQHDSVWHPAAMNLPQIRPIIFSLMAQCEATRLGGVLITKVPPGSRVLPHIDRGWHPEYYNVKLYAPLQSNEKCVNLVENEAVVMRVGEVWYFDNTKVHEVVNDGDTDRITLIICMRVEGAEFRYVTKEEKEVRHHFAPHQYAKEMRMPAGTWAEKHVHKDGHFSILGKGTARVEVDGTEATYVAPAILQIAAGQVHKIYAETDVVWYCVHATEETDVERIDEVVIGGPNAVR